MTGTYMPESPNNTTFREQLNLAQHAAMEADKSMLSFGLGISDPKAIFGTTANLAESFGSHRVFDMPTSENAMTGIGIGAAIAGSRVLMTHQRMDFFLLAMDQLVNNAAKWHYMFNGQMKVPLTIRLIVGRGWGQGPTHAQNLQSWFAHVPGLKVVVPSKTDAVASQLYSAIMDDNPVIFIEHRWLHEQQCGSTSVLPLQSPHESVRVHRQGADCTIVANSFMVLEALIAADFLQHRGINVEVVETVSLEQSEWQKIYDSVEKTGRLLVCDSAHGHFSVASEVVSSVTEQCFKALTEAPRRLCLPPYPEPTSYYLTKPFYRNANDIVAAVAEMMGVKVAGGIELDVSTPHDVPGNWFKGPF
ncbi:hypothetical protein OCL06_10375 [Alteromonas sp. ASW11-19]|uniref:Transketolase-like pyrimidine-binding domain-containing protein n=1 Tax=Alteromonas salexigens TaxID=2982530 RepID=A0ABT2VNW5_9ALTE|nr:transketolase C-terminal domain-containing protein [Alteromonas salexigens]MCU7555006.1 hypothetical protein [Alteromonas salexigens]